MVQVLEQERALGRAHDEALAAKARHSVCSARGTLCAVLVAPCVLCSCIHYPSGGPLTIISLLQTALTQLAATAREVCPPPIPSTPVPPFRPQDALL